MISNLSPIDVLHKLRCLQDDVGVLSGLVGKARDSDVGLSRVRDYVRLLRYEARKACQLLQLGASVDWIAHFESQVRQYRAEVRISTAFAPAVYGSLDVDRTGLNG